MKNKFIGIVLVVIAIIAISGLFFPKGKTVVQQVKEKMTGALVGPSINDRLSLNAGFTAGGTISTSTGTITAYTTDTNGKDFGGLPTVVQWLPNANQTLTIAATSTHGYVPNVGDVAEIYFLNSSTTAAATITFAAANANLDLQFAEATGGDLVLNGLDWAKITLIRTSAYKTTMIFDEMTEAD